MLQPSPLQDLPDDVLLMVLGWLPVRSRVAAMGVCRRWRRVGLQNGPALFRIVDVVDDADGCAVTLHAAGLLRVASGLAQGGVVQLRLTRAFGAARAIEVGFFSFVFVLRTDK